MYDEVVNVLKLSRRRLWIIHEKLKINNKYESRSRRSSTFVLKMSELGRKVSFWK